MASVQVVVRQNLFGTAASRFVPAVKRHKQAAIQRGVAVAQQVVPVRTGYLKSTIHATEDGFEATADYAVYPEYGTYKMAARPYMRPGAAAMQQDFLSTITGLEGEIV